MLGELGPRAPSASPRGADDDAAAEPSAASDGERARRARLYDALLARGVLTALAQCNLRDANALLDASAAARASARGAPAAAHRTRTSAQLLPWLARTAQRDALPLLRKLQWEFAAELRAAEAALAAARRVEIAGPDGELEVREGGAAGDGEGIGGPTPAGLGHPELIAQRVAGHQAQGRPRMRRGGNPRGGAALFEFAARCDGRRAAPL